MLQECLHPTARRAASLELVGDRYLLLHGGYAGTHQLLQDTWVFDTHTNRWLEVDVSGELVACLVNDLSGGRTVCKLLMSWDI